MIVFTAMDNLSGIKSAECSVNNGNFSVCTSPLALAGLSAGPQVVRIRANDNAANISSLSTISWTVDFAAPTLTISNQPKQFSNSNSGSFSFAGSAGGIPLSSYECSLDGGAFSTCSSPKTYSSLTSGGHNFKVRGTSTTGAVSSPVGIDWMIDLTPPNNPTITASVTSPTKTVGASFTFTSDDSGSMVASYECSLDNAPFSNCTSPRTLSALTDGTHNFRIRATDNAGNVSGISTFTWMLDTVVPALTMSSAPAAVTIDTNANFNFTASDSGSGVFSTECRVDAGSFTACTSPKILENLSQGSHSFQVKVTDKAGNVATIAHGWMINAAVLDGSALYTNNCAGCHGPLATSQKLNKTAAQINNALSTVPAMAGLKPVITADMSEAISKALATSVTTASCISPSLRGLSKQGTRRLNRYELELTMRDVLPIQWDYTETFANYPEVEEVDEISKFDVLYSKDQAAVWAKEVDRLADYVIKNPDQRGFGGQCFQQSNVTADCWTTFFRDYGRKVYRRPLSTDETTFLTNSVKNLSTNDGIYQAMHMLFRSPDFLFHFETGVSDDGIRVRLTDHEVANRIAYTITGAPPDSTLASAADRGELKTVLQAEAQAKRLVETKRAKEKLRRFFADWLQISKVQKPVDFIADWMNGLGHSDGWDTWYRIEIYEYVTHVIWKERGTFKDLMTRQIAFPRGSAMSQIYTGAKTNFNSELVYAHTWQDHASVPYSAPNNPGLALRAGLLASGRMATSPILRGAYVLRRLLCEDLPSPDFSIVTQRMDATGPLDPAVLPTYDIVTKLTSSGTCLTCHSKINPMGFALEGYDQLGQLRSKQPVYDQVNFYSHNPVGIAAMHPLPYPVANLSFDKDKVVTVNAGKEFADNLAASTKAKTCMATHILRNYERRKETPNDGCALAEVLQTMDADKSILDVFVKSIANEDVFWRGK